MGLVVESYSAGCYWQDVEEQSCYAEIVNGREFAGIGDVDVGFGEHSGEGDECEPIVGATCKNDDSDVGDIVDLFGVLHERIDVFDKDDDVCDVG